MARAQLADVGTAARRSARAGAPVAGAAFQARLRGVSGRPQGPGFSLRLHALDILQVAGLRPRGRLHVRHVYSDHQSEPDQAVLRPGAALFAAGDASASWRRTVDRAENPLGGAYLY